MILRKIKYKKKSEVSPQVDEKIYSIFTQV